MHRSCDAPDGSIHTVAKEWMNKDNAPALRRHSSPHLIHLRRTEVSSSNQVVHIFHLRRSSGRVGSGVGILQCCTTMRISQSPQCHPIPDKGARCKATQPGRPKEIEERCGALTRLRPPQLSSVLSNLGSSHLVNRTL
jgi:hypothetical protein